ncbi:hypothetical protein RUM43_014313 [Polyplax serrata]|uniref:Uncharacterized protein n=1 Tax=Polyplax serrata TaxID=468196 RepID=A0AAN8S3M7_POLSC
MLKIVTRILLLVIVMGCQVSGRAVNKSDGILNFTDSWDFTGGNPRYKVIETPIWNPLNRSQIKNYSYDEMELATLEQFKLLKTFTRVIESDPPYKWKTVLNGR